MVSCALRRCPSSKADRERIEEAKNAGVTFHRFPRVPYRLRLWLKFVQRGQWEPTKSSVLCSKHFTANCFVRNSRNHTSLRHDAIPTLYPENDQMTQDECSHTIQITNFHDRELVTYPIIKIAGTIEGTVCTFHGQPCQIICYRGNRELIFNQVSMHGDTFKIILKLSLGVNDIFIKLCRRILKINIEYRPRYSMHSVVPLYIICKGHTGEFQAPPDYNNDKSSACARIGLCSQLLQCVTAEKLWEHGLGRKSFSLECTCDVFYSQLSYEDARKMKPDELWQYFGREILASRIGSPTKKYLAFLSCTYYNGHKFTSKMKNFEDLKGITEGYVALGGGGLALFGTACLYTWPEKFEDILCCFESNSPVEKTKFLDDSCYRGTLGACFSTTFGSVLHELYHTFNLGHTENGIMGRGFDNISKFFIASPSKNKDAKLSQIEFREEFEAGSLSERLKKANEKKLCNVTRQYQEDDDTVLEKSCAVLLYYHRWFNDGKQKDTATLAYDKPSRFIKSTSGIRVIQIRRVIDELVQHHWTFHGIVLKFSFRLPDEIYAVSVREKFLLFVEDTAGNILKDHLF